MRFISVLACVVAGVVAQTSSAVAGGSTNTACAAQNILDTCLGSTNAIVQGCGDLDWKCKCTGMDAVITCYNNCPNDPGVSTAQGLKTQYCVAASQAMPASTSSSAVSGSITSQATTTTAAGTTSKSSSSATAKSTNAAMAMYGSGSGLVAAAIGVAALL